MSEELAIKRRKGLYGFEFLADDPDLRRVELRKDHKDYNIKQLWQVHHEIINLTVRGFSSQTVAEILNIDPRTVNRTLESDLGQHKISELRRCRDEETKVVQEKIRVLTNKALQIYSKIFDDESGECNLNDKKKAADTVLLELSGLRAPTKVQSTHASLTLSREDINAFKNRALEEAEKAGIIIDVEKPKEITNLSEHDSVEEPVNN